MNLHSMADLEALLQSIKNNYHYRLYMDSVNKDIGTFASGNWGHKGILGHHGGSMPGGGKKNRITVSSGVYSSSAKMKAATKKALKEAGEQAEKKPTSFVATEDKKYKLNFVNGDLPDEDCVYNLFKSAPVGTKFGGGPPGDSSYLVVTKTSETSYEVSGLNNYSGDLATAAKDMFREMDGGDVEQVEVNVPKGSTITSDFTGSKLLGEEQNVQPKPSPGEGTAVSHYAKPEETYDLSAMEELSKRLDIEPTAFPDSASMSEEMVQRRANAPMKESKDTMDAMLRPMTGKVWNTLSNEEKDAICTYTGEGYMAMNSILRTGKVGDEVLETLGIFSDDDIIPLGDVNVMTEKIAQMKTALSKSKLPEMWVTRGVGASGAAKYLGIDPIQMQKIIHGEDDGSALIGKTIKDNGFMSCGTTADSSFPGVQFRYFVPEGTSGMYVEPVSENGYGKGRDWNGVDSNFVNRSTGKVIYSSEFETILQAGTTARIMGIKKEGRNVIVESAIVAQDP